jgi:hypothetical protein
MANDPKALTETPEFKAAVAEAVASSVASEVGKILASLKAEGAQLSSGDHKFAENLALAFATLSEQGTGRKYVAPEILRVRSEARDKMFKLIISARKDYRRALDAIGREPKQSELLAITAKYVPSYRVAAKTLLDNQVVQPFWVDSSHIAQPTEIDWPGVPNDALVPLNDVAREIHAAFRESIGSKAQSVSATGAVTDAPDPMDDGYGTTANGLVVRGGAVPRRNRPETTPEHQSEEGLALHHRNKPGRTKEIHVLGTIAPPAQQTI